MLNRKNKTLAIIDSHKTVTNKGKMHAKIVFITLSLNKIYINVNWASKLIYEQ